MSKASDFARQELKQMEAFDIEFSANIAGVLNAIKGASSTIAVKDTDTKRLKAHKNQVSKRFTRILGKAVSELELLLPERLEDTPSENTLETSAVAEEVK